MYRRQFLRAGALLAGSALSGGLLSPEGVTKRGQWSGLLGLPEEPDPKTLAHAALEAARAAGARYADVILRTTRTELWGGFGAEISSAAPYESFAHGIGVRALVGGCWGVTGIDGAATLDEAAQLGRDAAAQAATADRSGGPTVELAATAPVVNGWWATPIERDPFTVPAGEKLDFLSAMCDYTARFRLEGAGSGGSFWFQKVDTTMASTDGTDYSQTTYTTGGGFSLYAAGDCRRGLPADAAAEFLTPAGAGWEYIRTAPFRESISSLLELTERGRNPEPAELGQYEVVFDAYAMAALLSGTLGAATALDRAMGFSARGVGTSFLSDPLAMLGTLPVASPLVTVTANRSLPRGAATVGWDDEGVVPQEATLVKNGILTDFQTTRESASWLAPYYQRAGLPVRSNGCSGRGRASSLPAQCPPNLALAPGREALGFDDLVRSTPRGYAICGGRPYADWQALTVVGGAAQMYRIKDGKLGRAVDPSSAHYLFRTPEFWKSIVALGGPTSARMFGLDFDGAATAHTVVAVPAKVRQLRLMRSS